MLYSLALNATESERWYAVLQEYAAGHPEPEEHRLAESWLVYLDISLPHRGSTNLIEVLDEAARMYGDNVFEKCGINRDGAGEVGGRSRETPLFQRKRHF